MYRGWQLPTQSLLALPIGGTLFLLRDGIPIVLPLAVLTVILAAKYDKRVPHPVRVLGLLALVATAAITGGWSIALIVLSVLGLLTVALNWDRCWNGNDAKEAEIEGDEWLNDRDRRRPPKNGGVVLVDKKELLEIGVDPVTNQLAATIGERNREPGELGISYGHQTVEFTCQGRSYTAFEDGGADSIESGGTVLPRNLVAMGQVPDDWLGTNYGPRWRVQHIDSDMFAIIDCNESDLGRIVAHLAKSISA